MSKLHWPWLALALLAVVLLAGACDIAGRGSVPEGDVTRGGTLWVQSSCVGCHGINAEGSAGGPALANTPLSLAEATSITRRGVPGMPEYPASQVSNQDLQDMYAWWQNPVPVAVGELGQDPWTQLGCGGCHGANAQGASATALAGKHLSYGEFQRVVRGGREGMPAYSTSQISDQDLQRMYDWLQNPVPAATAELAQDPWTQSPCSGCHGVDALGASASGLAGTSQPYDAFRTVVRQGTEGMPPFSEAQISDQTLQAIYDWLQAQAQVPATQQALWTQLGCSGCHGANAEGASETALTGEDLSYSEFQRVVRGGEEGMPAYSTSRISDVDLRRMYDWLMALP
jgi:mono/diheme cytochrome c family protein